MNIITNLKKKDIKRVNINQMDLMLHHENIKNIKNNIWKKLII